MYAGEMVEFGTLHDVYKKPLHPYTAGLLKSVPRMDGKKPEFMPGVPPNLSNPPTRCRFASRCPQVMEKCSKDVLNFIQNQHPPKMLAVSIYLVSAETVVLLKIQDQVSLMLLETPLRFAST